MGTPIYIFEEKQGRRDYSAAVISRNQNPNQAKICGKLPFFGASAIKKYVFKLIAKSWL
jgi:hypothetical protein